MKNLFLICMTLLASSVHAQQIFPTSWFTGMKNNKLQLLVHKEGIATGNKMSVILKYPSVKVTSVEKLDNPNYIVINLVLNKPRAGKMPITVMGDGKPVFSFSYELKARTNTKKEYGVTSKDFIYLLMPDRFSNGDIANDVVDSYREQATNKADKFKRHGGDFKGIENHLDYLQQLGVTTLWLTPVIENNTSLMHEWGNEVAGYHGYWFTNQYEIDKRYGGNEGYKEFSNAVHKKGMKVIQDAVYNHVGREHWSVIDPPAKDWLNNWSEFTGPNHREEVLFDPYGSQYDKTKMLDGWFVDHLPDLNQRNPYVANYLIQYAIWATEMYGVDAWRVDTYKYCDEAFMNKVNNELYKEFPGITIFGEAWVNTVIGNAYFTKNNFTKGFKHNANGVIDFQSCFAMLSAMNGPQSWTDGVNKMYMTLAQDIAYENPLNNLIFLDNHDMDRVFSTVGEDWDKLKMGLTWLLTLRGIPQLYYGTEVLMKNTKQVTDAMVREDFPGGFPGDTRNYFQATGRNDKQNIAYNYISALANYRKKTTALTTGKLMQYVPVNNVYTYFRYNENQSIMIIANAGEKDATPDWAVFKERLGTCTQVRDVVTGNIVKLNDLVLKPKDIYVLELLKS